MANISYRVPSPKGFISANLSPVLPINSKRKQDIRVINEFIKFFPSNPEFKKKYSDLYTLLLYTVNSVKTYNKIGIKISPTFAYYDRVHFELLDNKWFQHSITRVYEELKSAKLQRFTTVYNKLKQVDIKNVVFNYDTQFSSVLKNGDLKLIKQVFNTVNLDKAYIVNYLYYPIVSGNTKAIEFISETLFKRFGDDVRIDISSLLSAPIENLYGFIKGVKVAIRCKVIDLYTSLLYIVEVTNEKTFSVNSKLLNSLLKNRVTKEQKEMIMIKALESISVTGGPQIIEVLLSNRFTIPDNAITTIKATINTLLTNRKEYPKLRDRDHPLFKTLQTLYEESIKSKKIDLGESIVKGFEKFTGELINKKEVNYAYLPPALWGVIGEKLRESQFRDQPKEVQEYLKTGRTQRSLSSRSLEVSQKSVINEWERFDGRTLKDEQSQLLKFIETDNRIVKELKYTIYLNNYINKEYVHNSSNGDPTDYTAVGEHTLLIPSENTVKGKPYKFTYYIGEDYTSVQQFINDNYQNSSEPNNINDTINEFNSIIGHNEERITELTIFHPIIKIKYREVRVK